MPTVGQDASVSLFNPAEQADQATIRALLNAFLRETGFSASAAPGKQAHGTILPFAVSLGSGVKLCGEIRYVSAMGQHEYGDELWIDKEGQRQPLDVNGLIQLLTEELGGPSGEDDSTRAVPAISQLVAERIRNSRLRMRLHLESRSSRLLNEAEAPLDLIGSEQSVFAGHPFHPYPKSIEGMTEADSSRYSPERAAAFQLYYFAAKRAAVKEQWLEGEALRAHPIEAVERLERQLQPHAANEYVLLPMHPWQAEYVQDQFWVKQAIERSDLIPLGLLGPIMRPTSSVRTVWDPSSGRGFKLPLHVRITNLVRVNTPEQSQRTIDAARIVRLLRSELEEQQLYVLEETGYAGLCREPGDEYPDPDFTVIYRPMRLDPERTFVLASLLESWPGSTEPKLVTAIRQSAARGRFGGEPGLKGWLERYLRLSLLPLLRVWAIYGISFEAHLQNTLVSLEGGWPERFYVRDLEGLSIDRQKAEQAGWVGSILDKDSPLLYEENAAWRRTQYYFIVNHLGSVIHTLSAWQGEPEEQGWSLVRKLLQAEIGDSRMKPYLEELLNGDSLPAKANFTSCMLDKGETPLFIPIPNPIKEGL